MKASCRIKYKFLTFFFNPLSLKSFEVLRDFSKQDLTKYKEMNKIPYLQQTFKYEFAVSVCTKL